MEVTAHYYGTMLSDYVDRSPYISSDPKRILLGTSIYKDGMLPQEIAEGIKDEFNQLAWDFVDASEQDTVNAIKDKDIIAAVLDAFIDSTKPYTDHAIDFDEFDEDSEYPQIYFYIDWS